MAERYLKIAQVNMKYNLLPHLIAALFMCLAAPLFIGTKNLDLTQSARVIEMYLSFLGILLLIPVFAPDGNREAADVIRTKKEPMAVSYIIRLLQSLLFLVFMGMVFLWYMKDRNCYFPMSDALYAFLSNTCFLGGIGMAAFALTDHMVFSYMVPFVYYIANIGAGSRYLGKFYLFSMQDGNVADKGYLLTAAVVCIVGAVYYKSR